jgi:alkylation response protein AidB-like acyl-CoA dehydrogenase
VDFSYSPQDQRFREEVRSWLEAHLVGEFAALGEGTSFGPRDWPVRVAWEQELGRGGWTGLSWPTSFGGREATIMEELIFAQEYARAHGPTRNSFFSEGLLGPTLMVMGSEEQQARFLPKILSGEEFWCQGFSEPDAGSDLASLKTRATLVGDQWRIDGQKIWTSSAQYSDWIFMLVRTDPDVPKHKGISMLLVPLDQPGIERRPIVEMTGGTHFCEVFFDGALTDADLIVGQPGDGWKASMATLGFERGTAFLAQQARFANDFTSLVSIAERNGAIEDPIIRQRLSSVFIGLELMRLSGYRTITNILRHGQPGPEASVGKLQWTKWHQDFGDLFTSIAGPGAMLLAHGDPEERLEHGFLFSRAETIYAGATEIQKNIISERVLGLPKEPSAR